MGPFPESPDPGVLLGPLHLLCPPWSCPDPQDGEGGRKDPSTESSEVPRSPGRCCIIWCPSPHPGTLCLQVPLLRGPRLLMSQTTLKAPCHFVPQSALRACVTSSPYFTAPEH